jgi:hypothetical protein
MPKELPKMTSIVQIIKAAALYPTVAMPDENHPSYPIPTPGAEGLRIAFLYCSAAIVEPQKGLQMKPPKYIAFFQAETGMFDELKAFIAEEWDLNPTQETWLGNYLTLPERQAPEFLTKQIRLYQSYDLLMVPFASGQAFLSDKERKAAIEFKALFEEISEKPLLPYYQAVGKQFFTWLDRFAR